MIAPLKQMYVTGPFGEVAVPGTGLPDSSGVKRHIGIDLRTIFKSGDTGKLPVHAPGAGKVTSSYKNATSGLQVIEALIDGKLHRFLHLSRRDVVVGQTFAEGQVIGLTGNSGGVPAHLHWDVRKLGTAYNASYYNYINPLTLINESSTQGELMDNDTKVANQYYTLRGNTGTAEERKGWIGKSYESFNATARAEVDGREAHKRNLENAVNLLTTERDNARQAVATLTAEVLGLRDSTAKLQAQVTQKDAEIAGMVESNKQLEAQHQAQIAELNKVIVIKDNEIKRLTAELANCDGESLTWSQHLVLGVKGFLKALNPLSK